MVECTSISADFISPASNSSMSAVTYRPFLELPIYTMKELLFFIIRRPTRILKISLVISSVTPFQPDSPATSWLCTSWLCFPVWIMSNRIEEVFGPPRLYIGIHQLTETRNLWQDKANTQSFALLSKFVGYRDRSRGKQKNVSADQFAHLWYSRCVWVSGWKSKSSLC